jgi:hypothetical protein
MHKPPPTGNLEKCLLNEDEKSLLIEIYKTRQRFFISSILILLFFAVLTSYRNMDDKTFVRHGTNKYNSAGDYMLSSIQIFILGVSLLGSIILLFAASVYKKRIVCFKKDLHDGYKYAIYKTILAREYFPMTDQYFVRLDDPKYTHHEIDAAIYNNVREGDLFPVYFAMHSHYAFNRGGTFTIL